MLRFCMKRFLQSNRFFGALIILMHVLFRSSPLFAQPILIGPETEILSANYRMHGKRLECMITIEGSARPGFIQRRRDGARYWHSFKRFLRKRMSPARFLRSSEGKHYRKLQRICVRILAAQGSGPSTTSGTATPTPTPTATSAGTPVPCGTGAVNSQDPTFNLDGEQRSYRIYTPGCYDSRKQSPLIIVLHGLCGNSKAQEAVSGWNAAAESLNVVLVYAESSFVPYWPPGSNPPAGCPIDEQGNPKWWGVTGADVAAAERYVQKVVELVSVSHNIDARRIYINGHSNGGYIAYNIANDLSTIFTGVIVNEGAPFVSSYNPAPPVPVAIVQNGEDLIVPPDLSAGYRDEVVSGNHATTAHIVQSMEGGAAYDETLYLPNPGQQGAPVLYVLFPNGGHADWVSPAATYSPMFVSDGSGGFVDINYLTLKFLLGWVPTSPP